MADQATPRPKLVRWIIGLPVAFFAVLMVGSQVLFMLSPDKENQWIDRESIRMCWQEREKGPRHDTPAQFVPGQCEELEFKFKQRWGINPAISKH